MMAGTGVNVGGAGMLRTRRRDVSVKPNRKLDRKSSRGMIYENEELRLRTIHINAEVEQGQNDIKKLRRENEQLRREIWSLRDEYDKLEEILKRQKGRGDSGEYEDRSDDDVHSDYSYEENEEIEEEEVDEEEEEINRRSEELNQEDEQLENAENQKISTEKMNSGSLHRLHVDFDDLSVVDEEEELKKDREKKEVSEEGQRKLQNGDHPLPPSFLGQLHQNIPFYPATYDPPPCDTFSGSSYYTECPFDFPTDAPTETSTLLAGMTSPCQTRSPFPDPLVPLTTALNTSTLTNRVNEPQQILPAIQMPPVGWQNNIVTQKDLNYSIPTTATMPSISSRNDYQTFPSNVPDLSQRRNILRQGKFTGNPFDESKVSKELTGNGWAFENTEEEKRIENVKESMPDAKILDHSVSFAEKPRHFFAPLPSKSRKEESPTSHFGTGNSSSSGKTGSTIVSRDDRNNFSQKGSADVYVNGAISFDENRPKEDNRAFLSIDNLMIQDEPRSSSQLTKSVSCQDLTSDSQNVTISEQLKANRDKPQILTKSDNTLDTINSTSGRPFKSHLNVTLRVPRVPHTPLSPRVPEIPKLPSVDYRLYRNPFLRNFEEPVAAPFDQTSPVTRPLSIQVNDNLGFHYPSMVSNFGRIQTEERYQRLQPDRLLIPSDQLGSNVLPSVLSPINKDVQATSFERPSPRSVVPPVPPYDFNTLRRITANRYLQNQALYQNQIPFLPLSSHVCPQRGVRMYYENVPKVPAQTQTSIDGDSHHEDETPQDEESLSVPSSPSGQRRRKIVRKASSGTSVQRDQKPLSPAAQRRLRKQSSVTSSETPDSPGKLGRKTRARKLSVTTTTTSEADKEDKNESRSSSSGQDSPRKDQTRRVSIYFNAKKRPSLTSVKTTRSGSLDAKDRYLEGGNLERERTNSVGSREVSGKGRKASTSSGNVPWCACWGNGCI